MDHRLVLDTEWALGWSGAAGSVSRFQRGRLPDPELCARLLTPGRLLDLVMRRSLAPPQLRLLRDGVALPADEYLDTTPSRRGQVVPMVDMRRLAGCLAGGCTLVLDAVQRFDPTLEVACRAWQWRSRAAVQVNIYLTTGANEGLAHWDDHDVLVVHLAGEKRWEVRGASRVSPLFRDAERSVDPPAGVVWSGVVRAGDVLYLPRGHWHQAGRAGLGEGFSLHLTFGFSRPTGVDWLAWLADQSRRQVLFRGDLDLTRQEKDREVFAAAVAELVEGYGLADFVADRESSRPPGRHVWTAGIFGPPAAVVCATDFPPRLDDTGQGSVVLTATHKKITFARAALPALTPLLSGNPVEVARVAAVTGVDAARLAEVLVREGVCAELTDELSSGYTGLTTAGSYSPTP
ncbi:JmjC domain-containing protein [Frankia sp. Cas3]|uniref:JmjC domain-containing protein n=1 Tax=Frankia sp. Cas3 TaxID=3073926 RepID=UPI002AD579DC|nr:cupin domain-containing protein [Frankia sp. Cas3]